MAAYQLPTGYVISPRGTGTTPTEQYGGVAMGITDATSVTTGNPFTQTFSVHTALTSGVLSERRSKPVQASGASHTFSATKAYSAGTFAYENKGGHRNFLIAGYSIKVNNVSNTTLQIMGHEAFRLRRDRIQKSWGAGTSTAWRAGYFRFTRVAGTRTNWSTAPSALNNTFKSTTNNGTDASDEAMYVTFKSIPGEFCWMDGSRNPVQKDYAARQ